MDYLMEIKTDKLIEDFYQEYGVSSLSLDEVKLVCKAQFDLVRNEMQSGKLRDVRLKYFGTFVVYPGRVKALDLHLDRQKEEGLINEQEYNRLKNMYNEYNNE